MASHVQVGTSNQTLREQNARARKLFLPDSWSQIQSSLLPLDWAVPGALLALSLWTWAGTFTFFLLGLQLAEWLQDISASVTE